MGKMGTSSWARYLVSMCKRTSGHRFEIDRTEEQGALRLFDVQVEAWSSETRAHSAWDSSETQHTGATRKTMHIRGTHAGGGVGVDMNGREAFIAYQHGML